MFLQLHNMNVWRSGMAFVTSIKLFMVFQKVNIAYQPKLFIGRPVIWMHILTENQEPKTSLQFYMQEIENKLWKATMIIVSHIMSKILVGLQIILFISQLEWHLQGSLLTKAHIKTCLNLKLMVTSRLV